MFVDVYFADDEFENFEKVSVMKDDLACLLSNEAEGVHG